MDFINCQILVNDSGAQTDRQSDGKEELHFPSCVPALLDVTKNLAKREAIMPVFEKVLY